MLMSGTGRPARLHYLPGTFRVLLIGDYHKNNDDCCAEVIGTGVPVVTNGVATSFVTTNPVFTVLPTPRGDDPPMRA